MSALAWTSDAWSRNRTPRKRNQDSELKGSRYRDTFDLDAWWAVSPTGPANALLDESMQAVARRHGLACGRRSWGETVSLELMDGPRKMFSLQIAPRDRYLDATLVAAWSPVRIESLRDNVASKMTALVERGAPRDLRDIHELCRRGLVFNAQCWELYEQKNPGRAPVARGECWLVPLWRMQDLREGRTDPCEGTV